MKILAVVSHFPMPQDHGDALRRLMVLQALNQLGELTVAAALRPTSTEADVAALKAALPGARVIVGRLSTAAGGTLLAKALRTAKGLITATPPWVYQQWSPALAASIRRLDGADFDAALLVGESSGAYAASVSTKQVVWDKSNVLYASDLQTIRSRPSLPAVLRALLTLPVTRGFEARVLKRASDVWVTSDEEAVRLERHYGRRASAIVPSCVKIPDATAAIDPSSRVLAWMSTLSYRPNWDGLHAFLRANDAALTARGMRLRVIGAGASAGQIRTLAGFSSVDYLGFVDDLRDAFAGVAFAIVPVWAGAGVKLKTLTFLGLGVPVVSTPVGMEGIPLDAATGMFETPEAFTSAIDALTPDGLLAGSERGRRIVESHFAPDSFLGHVTAAVANLSSTAVDPAS